MLSGIGQKAIIVASPMFGDRVPSGVLFITIFSVPVDCFLVT